MGAVRRPHERVRHIVRNQSSRHGIKPILIIVHQTEGKNIPKSVTDLVSLGNWFDNPAAQASSNVGVDSDGYSAQFVPDASKAWAQAYYNPWSLSIECVGFTAARDETVEMYKKVAQYIAYWNHKFDIPIHKGDVTDNGQIVKHGVLRHSELGRLGGDHHDPGTPFDLERAMDMARGYAKDGW